MFELAIVIAVFVLGIAVGMLLLIRHANRTVDTRAADAIQFIATQLIFLRVETNADSLFAYDAVSGDFVCQGSTMEDLKVNFGLRYPSKKGILVEPEKGEASELVQRN